MIGSAFEIDYQSTATDTSQAKLKGFKVIGFEDKKKIKFKLEFNNPLYVSAVAQSNTAKSADQIKVKLIKENLFVDPRSGKPVNSNLTEVPVPKQLPLAQLDAFETVQQLSSIAIGIGVIGLVVVNLFVGEDLRPIWDAFNIITFLAYTQKWTLSPPSNLQQFIDNAAYFARGDFISKEGILGNKKEDEPNLKQTKFFIAIGIAIVVISVICIVIAYLFEKCKDSKIAKTVVEASTYVKNKIIWSGFIRVVLQAFLDFAISALLLFTIADKEDDPEAPMLRKSRITVAVITTLLVCATPIGLYFIIQRMRNDKETNNMSKREFKEKYGTQYGTLWMGFRTSQSSTSIYYIVFMVRRLLFAVFTVFVGPRDAGVVLILNLYLSIAYSVYLLASKPNNTPTQRVEATSEIFLFYCFVGLMFCETLRNPIAKYKVGWWGVAAATLLVATLYLHILCHLINKLILIVKRIYFKNRNHCPSCLRKCEKQTPVRDSESSENGNEKDKNAGESSEYDSEEDEEKEPAKNLDDAQQLILLDGTQKSLTLKKE